MVEYRHIEYQTVFRCRLRSSTSRFFSFFSSLSIFPTMRRRVKKMKWKTATRNGVRADKINTFSVYSASRTIQLHFTSRFCVENFPFRFKQHSTEYGIGILYDVVCNAKKSVLCFMYDLRSCYCCSIHHHRHHHHSLHAVCTHSYVGSSCESIKAKQKRANENSKSR